MGTQPLPKPLEPKPPATYNNYDLHLIRHDPQQGEEDTSIKEAVPGVRVHYFDNLNWGAEIKIYAFGDERVLKLSQGGSGTVKFGANTVHLTLNHYSATEIVVSVDVVEPQ